jgi:hypothetical protein
MAPTFVGTDDGDWREAGLFDRPPHGWILSDAMAREATLSVTGASASNEGFRRAAREIVAQHPALADLPLMFDGPPDRTLAEHAAPPPWQWSSATFLHGTSRATWERIQREGIQPRTVTGSSAAHGAQYSHAKPGRTDAVYLTLSPNTARFAARDADRKDRSGPVVLLVRGVREERAIPDIDSGEDTARASLDRIGSIGYLGRIAPTDVALGWAVDPATNGWVRVPSAPRSNPGRRPARPARRATGATPLDDLSTVLLHGTLRVNRPAILRSGLVPRAGAVVTHAHFGEGDSRPGRLPKLVYATSPEEVSAALFAIQYQLAVQRGMPVHAVHPEDVLRLGMLAIVPRRGFHHATPSPYRLLHPPTVEPGDWYSMRRVRPIDLVYGKRLRDLVARLEGLEARPTGGRP